MTGPDRLSRILTDTGALPPGSPWRGAVTAVDRALFVPDEIDGVRRKRAEESWSRRVYADTALVTQTDDGQPTGPGRATSSSSQPSLMLEMLDLLDLHEGHSVLEIGTGTGYNAAWLAHRLGDKRVTSVETDPAVHARARENLEAAGYRPALVLGDGLSGYPDGAPYQRVLSTCTLRTVPPSLLEQCPHGRLVAPFGSSFHASSLLAMDIANGIGHGRLHGAPAFMWARSQRGGTWLDVGDVYHGEDGEVAHTYIDPRRLVSQWDARWYISLFVPDACPTLRWADDGSGEATLWLLADDGKSWATVEYEPGTDEFATEQYGPRRLWDEVAAAWRRWHALGRPERGRFGVTATQDGRLRFWLDSPDTLIATW
ncbi:methyltransferase domain-containing protein [Streptomyces sp. NRRL F-5053]|uniref:methyltransferase domain-containing protein n=1 Tax=Streptomyces sp. NRRL F-5053 TaxID=1463854 RepID=UPI0004C5625E|nr:methyltransferase domain-containing protein [Streptomyces sp. NRRL F-5053]